MGKGLTRLNSLRVKIAGLLLLVSLVPLATVSAVQYDQSIDALNKKTMDGLTQRAELNAIIMNNWMTTKIGVLETLVKEKPELTAGDASTILAHLQTLDASDADIIKASFIDKNGMLRNTLGETKDASKFANFNKVKESKKVNISSIMKDSLTGKDIVIIDVPIVDGSNNFIGLIQSVLDPQLISTVVSRIHFENSGYGILLAPDGAVIASADKALIGQNIFDSYAEETREAAKSSLANTPKALATVTDTEGVAHSTAYSTVESTGWRVLVSAPESEVYADANALKRMVFIMIVISIVLVAVIALLVARWILTPILALSAIMKKTATGDLTHRLPEKGTDEFGVLRQNVNYMLNSFSDILDRMKSSIEVVAASSEQLSATSIQSSEAAEQVNVEVGRVTAGSRTQLESAGQTSTATEEMAAGVTRIAHSSSDVAESASGVTSEVRRGREGVMQAIGQIQAASHSVEASAQTVNTLQQKSMHIKQIVGVISEISSQTNMLALNASIEAARAGEHGRGFAVVAGEVKKLADQTSRSAVEIESIIADMLSAVASADQTMHVGLNEVSQGEALVLRVGETFDTILRSVQDVNDQIQEVSAAAQQISAGTEEVAASATDVFGIAQDTSTRLENVAKHMSDQLQAMKEISGSSEALSHMAVGLQEAASKFKTK
ncbi:methyl-accepting chemotaxis protein [Paenibacillus methanolicus]|uniref:Methyl-accepting chemotaxis protein n=1 Tax=Paenibacillus methanolicus TaxID=582686 RepID=A0A5S5CHM7_9BACL|nr:methyl-accepting chemotaxis protein [Paenibacillus methanolicus]TYP77850.1 methyl-accepting chemotaxis protein [Paenibacillus methanolicus]